jgi:predicted RNase H-like nuclease
MKTKPYSLNKNRFRDAKIVALIAVIIAIFSRSYIPEESIIHEIDDLAGMVLIAIVFLAMNITKLNI